MKIKFEKWIDDNSFSYNIKDIFAGAVTCYKNGVNRAALILSYIAFMNLLKERLLNSKRPDAFPEDEWKQLLKNSQNESCWERILFTTTQKGKNSDQKEKNPNQKEKKYPVFLINDDIRTQISYWKDRRNDCAHCKSNIIDTCHVDAFWAFLQSNLNKITVEGGKQSLLNKFTEFFDRQYTPIDADITPLIKQIEYCVDLDDLDSFWQELITIGRENQEYDFIDTILLKVEEKIATSLINFLKTKKQEYFFNFLSHHPERVARFFCEESDIRNFWQEKLYLCRDFLNIYANILNADLIPKEQINEANLHIIEKLKNYTVKPQNNSILEHNNFIKDFENRFFTDDFFNKFMNVNSKAIFLYEFLRINDFTPNIVKVLCNHCNATSHSYTLRNRLLDLFSENKEKKKQFEEIAQKNLIKIPKTLKQEVFNKINGD